jgi:hypothetical protein
LWTQRNEAVHKADQVKQGLEEFVMMQEKTRMHNGLCKRNRITVVSAATVKRGKRLRRGVIFKCWCSGTPRARDQYTSTLANARDKEHRMLVSCLVRWVESNQARGSWVGYTRTVFGDTATFVSLQNMTQAPSAAFQTVHRRSDEILHGYSSLFRSIYTKNTSSLLELLSHKIYQIYSSLA